VGLQNILKLFRTPSGEYIRKVRVSTLARYFWCSAQAWMQALGVEGPPTEAKSEGTIIHTKIEKARKPSSYEKEFKEKLEEFFANGIIARPWFDQKNLIHLGELVTHGIDDFKVTPDRQVDLIEYKTKTSWRVYPVDLMPAQFQAKLYAWVLEPYLIMFGYRWRQIWIIFVKRERGGRFKPIGETFVEDYDPIEVEKQIAEIFDEWNKASEAETDEERRNILIPPKKYKCLLCPEVYRLGKNELGLRCPFS